jgi:methyl-accepting chemotaxis protein
MTFLQNLSIARKLIAAFAVVILVTGWASAMIYQRVGFIEDATLKTAHSCDMLAGLEGLLGAVSNQEGGLRGYLVSPEKRFLDGYQNGYKDYLAAFASLTKVAADDPQQAARITELGRAVDAWHTEWTEKQLALASKPETVEEARSRLRPAKAAG